MSRWKASTNILSSTRNAESSLWRIFETTEPLTAQIFLGGGQYFLCRIAVKVGESEILWNGFTRHAARCIVAMEKD